MPQLTAIMDVCAVAKEHNVPVIADGGIRLSGDITKAIAGGANSVMVGSLFAGCAESPGDTVLYDGRTYKVYRGMGSMKAMQKGSKARYMQQDIDTKKLVPEGVEGRVPYRGSLADSIHQLMGGLRSGMGYCGAKDLASLQSDTEFVKITAAGMQESHPHDITITEEPPNYHL